METMNVQAILSVVDKGFTAGMREAQNAVREFERETNGLDRVASTLGNVGTAMTVGLTAPVVAGVGASVKAFADFETAMRGVSKTTDLTGSEFEALSKEIQNMSMEMPVAATEIAGVAEAAGQLGIEKEHILDFTENMVKLGTATDLSAEEAAVALARLANITKMPQTEFENLGSTVVELGNNMAATESEIVNMGLRLAGTGSQIGLTEAQILALSASMASVGIEAEAGGTNMSKVLQKMDSAVRESGAELEGYAQISGMTAQEFATAWKNDPQTAIVAFIEGLGHMIDSGEDANGALEALGITGVRETDVLKRLAGAGDLTAEAFDMANQAWEENTALSDEASEAWNTLASQAQILWNQIVVLAQEIGARLAPAISNLIDMASNLVTGFLELDAGTQNIILAFVGVVAAIGPLLIAVSAGIKMFQFFSSVSGLLSGALTTAGVAAKVTAAVIGFLTSPIGLVVGAIVALIGVLVYLYNTNETVRNAINVAWNFIKDTIISIAQSIWDFLLQLGSVFVTWYQENQETIKTATTNVWNFIKGLIQGIMAVIVPIVTLAWTIIKEVTQAVWQAVKGIVEAGLNLILSIVTIVMAAIAGDWSAVWEGIKGVASAIWQAIITIIEFSINTVGRVVEVVLTTISAVWSTIWNAIKTIALNIWNDIKSVVTTVINAVRSVISNVMSSIQSAWSSVWNAIKSVAQTIWNAIKSVVTTYINGVKAVIQAVLSVIKAIWTGNWDAVKSTVSNIFSQIVSTVRSRMSSVRNAVSQGMQNALNAVTGFFGRFKQAGSNLIGNIADGIRGAVGKVTGAISGVLSKARNMLPFSPPKDKSSPIADVHKSKGWGDILASGILNAQSKVQKAMDEVLDLDYGIPTIDIAGSLARSNAQVESAIRYNLSDSTTGNQPAYINLAIGGQTYVAFVEDISREQAKRYDLEKY